MSGDRQDNPSARLIGLMLLVFVLMVGAIVVSAFFALVGYIFGG